MKAPERRCPQHDLRSIDLVCKNSKGEDVYRCLNHDTRNALAHYFTVEKAPESQRRSDARR